jgi:UDP-N-acetyl-2-amino-2-deoxyglucuronate dehydrogenase
MLNFGLVGAAGYVAPRHLRAIQETGNLLVAAADPKDSVGVLDHYFPEARFFTEIERFDRHLAKLSRVGGDERVHFLSICSPSYLHDAHVRLALRSHAHAICEKPVVINPWNVEALQDLEEEFDRRVYTVLQLRVAPALLALQRRLQALEAGGARKRAEVQLAYVTRRGPWYQTSWKGDPEKSGGIAVNIGIHLFDALLWLFGESQEERVYFSSATRMAGRLELAWASVEWLLSIDPADLPAGHRSTGRPAHRSLLVDGERIDFSDGFADLHTRVYAEILAGRGLGLSDAKPGIELAHRLRGLPASGTLRNEPRSIPR